MRVTLIVVNAIVGFTAILLMTGTLRIRGAAQADRSEGKSKVSDGRSAQAASGRREKQGT
jgi:hypothetical protein